MTDETFDVGPGAGRSPDCAFRIDSRFLLPGRESAVERHNRGTSIEERVMQ